jgi:hypothetical protein
MKPKRTLLLSLLLLLGGIAGLWHHAWQHQCALDSELITALEHYDNGRALALVNAGANPNTRVPRTSAVSQLVDQLRHHHWTVKLADAEAPTAFMMACGAEWIDADGKAMWRRNGPDDVRLVQGMLAHGATVKAASSGGATALLAAVKCDRPRTVALLLSHGGNVNAQDWLGLTPLYWIVAQVVVGRGDKEILGALLAHGAEPNIADKHGQTPLMIAQKYKRLDVVALLVDAGAMK